MKIVSLLSISALLATATPALAQMEELAEGGLRIPMTGEPQYHTLNLDTGQIRKSDASTIAYLKGVEGVGACYSNSIDDDGVTDALVFPPTDEIYDWGIKGCNGSDLVERITIGFSSYAVDISQGGPGGSLILRMYERGFGFGNFGTEKVTIALDGLPAGVPPGGIFGDFLTIELGSQSFFLPDGPIGWSYENTDGMTGPLLVDTTIPLGVQNYIDVYRPGPAKDGNYLGTFMFPPGGVSNDPFENSFWIELHQNETESSAQLLLNTSNPIVYGSLHGPVVGSPWDSFVLPIGQADFTFVVLALQDFAGPPTIFGEFLVDLTTQVGKTSIRMDSDHQFAIPLDATLIGVQFFAQAGFTTTGGSGLQLTNALEMSIGAF